MTLHDIIRHDLENRKPCHAPSQKEWIFAGHECEIPKPGDYFTMQLGAELITKGAAYEAHPANGHRSCW